VFGRAEGPPPPVDLAAERRAGDFLRARHALITAATDLSDGGLALAAFEMAVAGDVGVTIETGETPALFGEDQGRYLISCGFDAAEALRAAAARAGLAIETVGRFGGEEIRLGDRAAALAELTALWRGVLPARFG